MQKVSRLGQVSPPTTKCKRYETDLIIADPWFPLARQYSKCDAKNGKLTLKVRHWQCETFSFDHDRDVDATIERPAAGSR